jgi:hypothetical protein
MVGSKPARYSASSTDAAHWAKSWPSRSNAGSGSGVTPRLIERKAVEIDERIERLTDISARLQHAASRVLDCPVLLACVRAALPGQPPEPAADAHCAVTTPEPA